MGKMGPGPESRAERDRPVRKSSHCQHTMSLSESKLPVDDPASKSCTRVEVPTLAQSAIAEAIGTFFLVSTIALAAGQAGNTLAPMAIGSILMCSALLTFKHTWVMLLSRH